MTCTAAKALCALPLTLALLLGASATATAASPTQAARFAVDLRADQVETWTYDKPDDPADPCDAPSHGSGSQRVSVRKRGMAANVVRSRSIEGGRPLLAGTRGPLVVPITVDREGRYGVDYGATPPDCEAVGQGEPEPPAASDCGRRSGTGDLELAFADRNRLQVGVEPMTLEPAFLECPFWIGGEEPDGAGGIAPRNYRFPEGRLFDPRRKRLVLKGGTEKCFDETGFVICGEWQGPLRGRVVTTFSLTLRRR